MKAIGARAVHIVTADDTEVIIPHARLWSTSVSNASSGQRSLMCVTNFYLRADHDGAAVCQILLETGETSNYRKPETVVKVVAAEMPWGTRYKIKAYVADSREQFAMMTDLTIPRQSPAPLYGGSICPGTLCRGRKRLSDASTMSGINVIDVRLLARRHLCRSSVLAILLDICWRVSWVCVAKKSAEELS